MGTHVRRCVEILHPSSGGYRAWAKIADVQSDGVDYDVWVTDISLWRSYPVNRVRLERDQDGKFLEWDSGYTTLYNADGVCASAVFHWAPHGSSKVTTQTVYSNWA
ncbi:MAG: hypothetical protein J2O49_08870 [Sciscionella sp.]|nr:hypothetical protein [Sciscionella sp.]